MGYHYKFETSKKGFQFYLPLNYPVKITKLFFILTNQRVRMGGTSSLVFLKCDSLSGQLIFRVIYVSSEFFVSLLTKRNKKMMSLLFSLD